MEDAAIGNVDAVGDMLKKLSTLWKTRAAVNLDLPDYWGLAYDPTKSDFSELLLPFRDHPSWTAAPSELRSKVLSYAWAIYNLKTVYIECNVVTPACEDFIKAPPSSINRAAVQDVMSQVLLDEALHTRMSIMACNYIYEKNGIPPLEFVNFNLVQWRENLLSNCNADWERRLTRFAVACASETLITDYLKTMAEDNSIQPICHEVTRTHAIDEWGHSSVLSTVAMDVVHGLSNRERDYLRQVIVKTVQMFANNELGAWAKVFSMLQFAPGRDMLRDIGDTNEISVYTHSVETLLERVGLTRNEGNVSTLAEAADKREGALV
ncbi:MULTISPECIES: diiron oxygenase [unclassified Xanthobacter]|uniref:AurF N-oxygenase family protein n=1 Tax=unclassified Xanthobacter TaxID=2623496 RepID=UPI001F1CF56F|nr:MULTISPECIES: diiron oxygenase [unclassified Xanthobacter]